MKSYSVTNQTKPVEHYLFLMLFIMMYEVVLVLSLFFVLVLSLWMKSVSVMIHVKASY